MNVKVSQVSADYSTGGQITLSDVVDLAEAGFKTLICNRPDSEVETELHAQFIAAEAHRLGLAFVHNPISMTGLSRANITTQEKAMAEAAGPVFAYCRSGRRSTIAWALMMAGKMPADVIMAATHHAGYQLDALLPQIEALENIHNKKRAAEQAG